MEATANRSVCWRRYEAKYLVDEMRALWVQSFCRSSLRPDPYSARQPDGQYPIETIYLDSPTRHCLRGTLERQENRLKIRVRTYRDLYASAEDLPAFFEIKRKSHGLVHKTRAKVPYRLANQLLWSDVGYDFDAGGLDEMACENLKKFTCERAQIGAFPALAVHYTREAFETEMADRVRISLDRNLHYGLLSAPSSGERIVWRPVHCNWVILEIKFTNTYPFWIADLVRTGEISRRGVCKYVMCHEASQEPAVAAIA